MDYLPTCRGSYLLNTACGHCERCEKERRKITGASVATMPTSEPVTIPGLPEGVTVVRFGYAQSDDFFIAEGEIRRVGPRKGMAIKGLIVRPAPGYHFAFHAERNSFAAEKDCGDPINIVLHLLTHNETARAALTNDLKRFVGLLPCVTFNPEPDIVVQTNPTIHLLGMFPTE